MTHMHTSTAPGTEAFALSFLPYFLNELVVVLSLVHVRALLFATTRQHPYDCYDSPVLSQRNESFVAHSLTV